MLLSLKAQDAKLVKLQDRVNQLTLQEVATFEGTRLKPYQDQVGGWWIGSRHMLSPEDVVSGKLVINGNPVDFRDGITEQQARELLQQDLDEIAKKINKLVTVKLTDNQRGALVDFVFEAGLHNFASSKMLKELNAGNYDAVPREMMRWTVAGGTESPLIKRRREADVILWNTP